MVGAVEDHLGPRIISMLKVRKQLVPSGTMVVRLHKRANSDGELLVQEDGHGFRSDDGYHLQSCTMWKGRLRSVPKEAKEPATDSGHTRGTFSGLRSSTALVPSELPRLLAQLVLAK